MRLLKLASVILALTHSGVPIERGWILLELQSECSMMRHSDIRTTMNIYGDAMTEDMLEAHAKVVRLALASPATQRGTNTAN